MLSVVVAEVSKGVYGNQRLWNKLKYLDCWYFGNTFLIEKFDSRTDIFATLVSSLSWIFLQSKHQQILRLLQKISKISRINSCIKQLYKNIRNNKFIMIFTKKFDLSKNKMIKILKRRILKIKFIIFKIYLLVVNEINKMKRLTSIEGVGK